MLDAIDTLNGDDTYAEGSDAAIAIGLAGAVAAAASGITDWHQTDSKPLRIGFVHGMLNLSATALYTVALIMRKQGSRGAGKALALGAYSIAGISAHLGGDLVYKDQIGVQHAEPVWTPLEFEPAMADADLPEGAMRDVEVGGRQIMLARQNGQVHALHAHCAHLGGPLAEGKLLDGAVQCPWHGSEFNLADGSVRNGPAAMPQPCFRTRIRDGQIEVEAGQPD